MQSSLRLLNKSLILIHILILLKNKTHINFEKHFAKYAHKVVKK